jgi:hypothetical protein
MMRHNSLCLVSLISAILFATSAFAESTVSAFLYNPKADKMVLKYPYDKPTETMSIKPMLSLVGRDLPNGSFTLAYRIEAGQKVLDEGTAGIRIENGWFESGIELKQNYPNAKGVSWELSRPNAVSIKGYAPLAWSRFHGRVKYLDGHWDSTYIDLIPVTWRAPGEIMIPVAQDCTFDAMVPARVYAVVNVNGAGYKYNSMERWGWDFDLTKDREEVFTVGRTELYGMRAFDIKGGPPNRLLVLFRPTALSRLLKFDADHDGILNASEWKAMLAAMKDSPTVIGPELKADNVKVWLDDKPVRIAQFNQIPESMGDGVWQVLYLLQLQIVEPSGLQRGVWHEIKLEVESQEELRGKKIMDFGQGSIGYFRP